MRRERIGAKSAGGGREEATWGDEGNGKEAVKGNEGEDLSCSREFLRTNDWKGGGREASKVLLWLIN